MPKRRVNNVDMLDDIVDSAVDSLFERGSEFFGKLREQRVAQATPEQARSTYVCASCRNPFSMGEMEMINPRTEIGSFGMCRNCFSFVWQAGKEKIQFLAKKAAAARAAAAADAARTAAAAGAVARKPWEILGVSQDASVEEIKKAYRRLAAQYHPDMVPPGSPSEEKDAARAKFEEIGRAKDVMLKVRQAPGE